jgi:hypothetical protein
MAWNEHLKIEHAERLGVQKEIAIAFRIAQYAKPQEFRKFLRRK